MTIKLRISGTVALPLDAVTSTFALLAVRGAGKSNAARVMAEQMFHAKLPFVAIDPVGSWFGLRMGADGTPQGGLAIPIFGGRHGDVPLERGAGELIADLIVEQRLSCVLDLSEFGSEGDKKYFLLAFARRLYQKNQDPLHLFLEEADDYIPQRPMRDEAQLLRAWENIVRRGRSRGLGITLITQRSAAIAKMVLTQVETLFALRTTGPQDIAAIEAWVRYHGTPTDILKTLAGLQSGEAWVWSPHYLKKLERFQFVRCSTFDSGATPKGAKASQRQPTNLADVDLDALKTKMASTVERAKADDPKELRKKIADLEKQLKAKPDAKPERVEVPVVLGKDLGELAKLLDRADGIAREIREATKAVEGEIAKARTPGLNGVSNGEVWGLDQLFHRRLAVAPKREPLIVQAPTTVQRVVKQVREESSSLGGGALKLLTVLARAYPARYTRAQTATLAGVKSTTGTFKNNVSILKTQGLIDVGGQLLACTDQGLSASGIAKPCAFTREEVLAMWRSALPSGPRKILAFVEHGGERSREWIAEQLGVSHTTGTFKNNISTLRTNGLIVTDGPNIRLGEAIEGLS